MTTSGQTHTDLISTFLTMLRDLNPQADTAVLLVGSVARSAATAQSDLDLLVVPEQTIRVRRTASRLHIQIIPEADFQARLKAGDDFAAWCVRYAIPIVHADVWGRILRTADANKWPDWRHKIEHSARRLLLGNDLFQLGDEEAAAEELLYAISHAGRAVLLKGKVFPLSRPEMITQLNESEYPQLGAILEDFSFGRVKTSKIRQAIAYLKKLLVHLERSKFESYVRARMDAKKLKRGRNADARPRKRTS